MDAARRASPTHDVARPCTSFQYRVADELGETGWIERGSADQTAVDIRTRHIGRDVGGVHAAAVQNRYAAESINRAADQSHDPIGFGGIAILAGTDCPDRFVRDGDAREIGAV